jgi:hypothetical protein
LYVREVVDVVVQFLKETLLDWLRGVGKEVIFGDERRCREGRRVWRMIFGGRGGVVVGKWRGGLGGCRLVVRLDDCRWASGWGSWLGVV